MPENTIEIEDLSHRFGKTWALIRLSFTVRTGESIAVLGPNGSGKSTLLKILATRLLPTLGRGTILGRDIQKEAPQIRHSIEWLGHHFGHYSSLTVTENLRFSFKLAGLKPDESKIKSALAKTGLDAKENQYADSLSAGQKKRLALARILLKDPQLILLDEPHTNLDKEGKELMNNLIKKWKKEGKTLCMASHDIAEITPLVDRNLYLKG